MLKDEKLNKIADEFNIAQFASFEAYTGKMRFNNIKNFKPNFPFGNTLTCIIQIMDNSSYKTLNIRTFKDETSKSNPFVYGLNDIDEIEATIMGFIEQGYYVIISETIDVSDNGVSGVILGNTISFSPDATPRCVEGNNICTLPTSVGLFILKTVYNVNLFNVFQFDMNKTKFNQRIEFSVHPNRIGYKDDYYLIWEIEEVNWDTIQPFSINEIIWPNTFSKLLGDKVFGLLVAHTYDQNVPMTTVINKRIPPFTFGKSTDNNETWIRTCPSIPYPGRFTTVKNWKDPFMLLRKDESTFTDDEYIPSIVSQKHITAKYSGAAIPTGDNGNIVIIEGVEGTGENFMLGSQDRCELPEIIKMKIERIFYRLKEKIGIIQFEWVCDFNETIWIVQLHKPKHFSKNEIIVVPPEVTNYIDVNTENGIGNLKDIIDYMQCMEKHGDLFNTEILEALNKDFSNTVDEPIGINLIGNVSVVSHFGDLLRKAQIPSKITRV